MVGRVVRDIQREAPGFDVLVVDDGSTDTTARRGRRRGRDGDPPPLQPRDRRGGAVRLQVRAAPRLRRRGPGRRRRPAQARVPAEDARDAADRRRRGRHGLRQPLPRRPRLQGAARPPRRQHDLLRRAHRAHAPADHRPDLGLPDDQPARDRALRPRLPARLPRGRGAADAARAPPAHPRGPRADERARLRAQLDRLPAQRLLHGQGAAGAVRRPLPPPPDPGRGDRRGRARRRPSGRGRASDAPADSVALGAASPRSRCCAAAAATAATLQVTSEAESGPRLARRDDPRRRPRRHDRDPARHLPAHQRRHADRAGQPDSRGAGVDADDDHPERRRRRARRPRPTSARPSPPAEADRAATGRLADRDQGADHRADRRPSAIFLLVLELVRRRRLAERYALLWMVAAVALLVLAIWPTAST